MTRFVFALLLFPVATSAQVIQGKAVDATSGRPVADVDVRIEQAGAPVARAVTDSLGRFVLRASRGGVFRLATMHVAYAPVLADVEVGSGAMVELVLRLAVQPTELPGIEVVARGRAPDPYLERNGFYERKAGGFGVFRTPEEIERRRPFVTTDLFQSVNGVRVFNVDIRGRDIRMTRGEDPNCVPRVIIDNVIVRRGGRTSFEETPLDLLVQPNIINAIEIYRSPSETPREYAGNDVTCGVVLIWTRQGSARG